MATQPPEPQKARAKKPPEPRHAPRRKPGRPRQSEGEEVLGKLYKVALYHFLLKGIEDASIQTIAREAGVSRQMIHNRFGNKEQFFDEVYRQVESQLFGDLTFNASITSDDPWHLLEAIGGQVLNAFLSPDYIDTFRIMNVALYQHPEIARARTASENRFLTDLARQLTDAGKAYDIKVESPRKASRDFQSLITGLAQPALQGVSPPPAIRTRRKEIREMTERFLKGLGFPPRPGSG